MCGRYSQTRPIEDLVEQFRIDLVLQQPAPRFNVAPTQDVPVVRLDDEGRRALDLLRWGLVPAWAKDLSVGNRMINARAETVFEKPAFRSAFKKRRCLVVADGFYEWKRLDESGKKKQPYRMTWHDGRPFAFAGLWEQWKGPDGPVRTCTILTTTANAMMRQVHDRMPVILDGEEATARWLSPDSGPEELMPLLQPLPDDRLAAYPVSARVGSPRFDDPACIERLVDDAAG